MKSKDRVSWWRTSFGEEVVESVSQSIRQECTGFGPITLEFENRLAEALDVPFVITTPSGSVAMLITLMALGIKAGDEVIVPNRTWIATAHAPLMLGAKPILVDVLPDLPVMDVSQLKKKITSKTKAIIPVPLNGRAVDMDEVWKIAKEHGLLVIEDAAQGLFSKRTGKYMGTQSDAGCFSLSNAKLVPTGQGGFVVTKNKAVYEKMKRLRMHGVDDVINCTFYQMGFNFRFTDIQASIGLTQLDRVPKRIQHINEVYLRYKNGIRDFSFLKLIPVDIAKGEIPIYVEVLCKEREKLIDFMASHNIQARPFYPCLHTAKHLSASGEFPNADVFGSQGLVLPCGPEQPFENIDRVIETLRLFQAKNGPMKRNVKNLAGKTQANTAARKLYAS